MTVVYEKWNGVGNILNIIDNRDDAYHRFLHDVDAKRRLCSTSGADGIMEIRRPPDDCDDIYHVVYHSGLGICGTVPVCGNGSRCVAAYVCINDIVPPDRHDSFTFLAGDGSHTATYRHDAGHHYTSISMSDIDEVVKVGSNEYYANSGTAHLVTFIPHGTLTSLDITSEGWRLDREYGHLAPGLALHSDFTEDHGDEVRSRCFNPAVEREILACGTGSASIAVSHATHRDEQDGDRTKVVHWTHGPITVGYHKQGQVYSNITLQSQVYCELRGEFRYD